MDRREFMRLGFLRMKDSAHKAAPEMLRKQFRPVLLDVSVLSDKPEVAERLVEEQLTEHFAGSLIRLKQSRLSGIHSGGIVLFEQHTLRDYRDGASLFYASLRMLEEELALHEPQTDPVLLRFVNSIPAFSRSADVFYNNALVNSIPLAEDGRYEIEGALGPLRVVVARQRLVVVDAPCTHKLCCAHPAILTPGQRITCVPSRISIAIGFPLE